MQKVFDTYLLHFLLNSIGKKSIKMAKEIWKPIPGFKYYEASNLGRVRSLDKFVNGLNNSIRLVKGRVLKNRVHSNNYYFLNIVNDDRGLKNVKVHQLVAMAFLNHKPCGLEMVVDHINGDRKDNRLENLRVVTQRENLSYKRKNSSSKYTGVSWSKERKKWMAGIKIKGRSKNLGSYETEYEAHLAYQKALNDLKQQ